MTIRRAEKDDVEKLVELGKIMHKESVYSKYPFDQEHIKRYGDYMIENPDEFGVFFSEDSKGNVNAMVGGHITKMWFNPAVKIAFDLMIYSRPEKRGSIAVVRVVKAFEQWAKGVGASSVTMGVTAGINNDMAAKFLSAIGYDLKGSLLNKEL